LSGLKYKQDRVFHNCLNLCLFTDSTPILGSKNLQMWVVTSSIIDLPHKVRDSMKNLVVHSIIIGNSFDFSRWFELYFGHFGNIFNSQVHGNNF
jgi:hypothetical protein